MTSIMWERLARPALFRLDPERAHQLALLVLSRWKVGAGIAESRYRVEAAPLRVRVLGLDFPNPVGLAAGADKNGEAVAAWSRLGFGFVEVGTITPLPQEGNPRPRVFRLPEDRAVINRLGFNNDGAEAVARRLAAAAPFPLPLGINVGRNKTTPNERAIDDYVAATEALARLASYLVLNVSSPNTTGLRELQKPAAIRHLVEAVRRAARGSRGRPGPPVLVKLAPDWEDQETLELTVAAVLEGGAAGLIATNTTVSRPGLLSARGNETGGLSGHPLTDLALAIFRKVRRVAGPTVPLIGVGGIDDAETAWRRLTAGASLLQLYTGFVYQGPALLKRINLGLLERMEQAGVRRIEEIVGQEP